MKLGGIQSDQFGTITKFFSYWSIYFISFESNKNILCLLEDSSNSDKETKEPENEQKQANEKDKHIKKKKNQK